MAITPETLEKPKRMEVIYPESDGKPMAETDTHRDQMLNLIAALQAFYRDNPNIYVSGNIFVYYEEGNPRKSVSPDVLVVKGVEKRQRRYYQVWAEEKAPDVVFEITSTSTRSEDLDYKYTLYEQTLKVPEYFLFDPLGEYLRPPLQGYRLVGDRYIPLMSPRLRLKSEELGLELRVVEGELRLYNPPTGQLLLTPDELNEALLRESEARQRLEIELEQMRLELEALRARE